MSPALPRLLAAALRAVAPARDAADIVADLEIDYARVRATRSRLAAARWLGREAVSLLWAFAVRTAAARVGARPVVVRDLTMVMRGLRRTPIAAAGAAATLAVGGLSALVTIGLADALLLRPVSARHGDAVRRVAAVDRSQRVLYRFSYLELEQVRRHVGASAVVSAVNLQPAVIGVDGADRQTLLEVVDGDFFDLMGGGLVLGRGLLSADDRRDAAPVVVLSESLWRRQFDGDPGVVGRIIRVNRAAFTVVGVRASSGAAGGIGQGVDAWTPLAHADAVLTAGWRTDPEARWFSVFLLPSRPVPEVESRLAAAGGELARLQPERWRDRVLRTAPGSALTGSQRSAAVALVWTLLGLSALTVVAGAANVLGVLVARGAASERQTAIHLSMGAGRAAVARRLLLEGLMLGAGAGALTLALYVWVRRGLAELALLPTLSLRLDLPLTPDLAWSVLLVSGGAGVLLAAGPAVWAARVDISGLLAGGAARAVGGPRASRLRRMLVATQIAVSLALVVGAVQFTSGLDALAAMDVGFPRAGLVAMDFDLQPAVTAEHAGVLAATALQQAARINGVTAAAMSNRAPIDASVPVIDVRRRPTDAPMPDVTVHLATADYFRTVGVPMLAGRAFSAAECDAAADVAVVNETLARTLWGGDAVGQSLVVGADRRQVRVVGVARDARYRSLHEARRPHLYRPTPPGFQLTLLVRTQDAAGATLRALQTMLDGVGPGITGFFPRTFEEHLEVELLPVRAGTSAATLLGALAFVVSVVGLYGVVAWFVERQRREIGVRVALGAGRAAVARRW